VNARAAPYSWPVSGLAERQRVEGLPTRPFDARSGRVTTADVEAFSRRRHPPRPLRGQLRWGRFLRGGGGRPDSRL